MTALVSFEAEKPVGVNDLYQPGWSGFGPRRRPAIRKSTKGMAFCARLLLAARVAWRRLRLEALGGDENQRVPVAVTIRLAFPTYASDIDGPVKPTLDALQAAGIVWNDNRVDELHVFRLPPDRARPRVEVEVREVA